ncbi:hypothetical protein Gocc_2099 [Gaiella occulta]|uniref:DUF1440 domain-containing protein n=1 Tax=Gaiella occulta TaxID=1002870 RepID=A0A7M2YV32_9ACTN|nr:hypothetical protein Gocc_2099 [Gaiella occulta]
MSARHVDFAGWSAAKRVVAIGAAGGAIGGMMLAMVEMLYGWLSDAHTFWDAPMAIWAWVGGIEHFGSPGNHVGPIVLGLGGHMVNSMMIGVGFAVLMAVLRPRGDIAPIMAGVVYGLGVWVVMRYVILPLNSGEDDLFTTSLVSPQWVWWLGHAVLGMAAGVFYTVARRAGLVGQDAR